MSVHPRRPCFTSNRMAMGSKCSIRPAICSIVSPKCRAVAAQMMLSSILASSMKGMVYSPCSPLYI